LGVHRKLRAGQGEDDTAARAAEEVDFHEGRKQVQYLRQPVRSRIHAGKPSWLVHRLGRRWKAVA